MQKIKYRFRIYRQIKPYIRGVRWFYAGDMVTEILVRGITLLFPVLYGILLEQVILAKEEQYLWQVLLGYFLLQLLKSLFLFLQKICQNRVVKAVSCEMKTELLRGYFDRTVRELDSLSGGDVKMTIEEAVEKMAAFPAENYRYLLNGIYILVIAVVLLRMNLILTFVAAISIPVTFLLDHLVSRREKKVNDILNENDASWASWLDESIHQWQEIRVYGCEKMRREEFARFQRVDETYFSAWLRFWVTRVLVIPKIKDDFFMNFLLYFLGGIMIYYDRISIGVLLVFIQYFSFFLEQVKAFSQADATMQSQMAHYRRVLTGLEVSESADCDCDMRDIQTEYTGLERDHEKDLVLEDVSFAYEDGEKVIEHLNLKISQGERVGILGESGSGKSTLVKLILGVLVPTEGMIRYGASALTKLDQKSFYGNVAYIGQEAKLYNESVWDNLRLAKADAGREEMEEACKTAGIYEVIKSLPDGFDTVIGENGANLSGGQRQRLILAKAFLKDPDIFVLDEATSALDHQAEGVVNDSLSKIPRDKTVLIVAHKESSLKVCDRLVRLS